MHGVVHGLLLLTQCSYGLARLKRTPPSGCALFAGSTVLTPHGRMHARIERRIERRHALSGNFEIGIE
jgi:hypothetical protein